MAVVIAVTVAFSVMGGINFTGTDIYGETFAGSISETSYDSKEAAARGFVTEELTDSGAAPEYTGYKKIAALTEAEIADINARNSVDTKILGGERVEIEYEKNPPRADAAALRSQNAGAITVGAAACQTSATAHSVDAYLLESASDCRYYVLPPEVGGVVTNTYLKTVFDGSKYLNCTATTVVGMSVYDIMTTYRQVIQFDGVRAHFSQELPGLINELYFKETAQGITAYTEHPDINDGKFYSLSEINAYYAPKGMEYQVYLTKGGERVLIETLSSIEEVTDFAFMMNVDASFFVKTANGFAMTDDKYKEVCKMLAGGALGDEFDEAWNDLKVYFRADYYVSQGRLSKSETVLRLLYDGNFITLSVVSDYTSFGATKVIIPKR